MHFPSSLLAWDVVVLNGYLAINVIIAFYVLYRLSIGKEYSMAVIGRYHQVGSFLTDVASLRRIMVSSDLKLAAANIAQARVLGDTTAMIEARFTIRTYVKAKADSTTLEEPDAP